MLIPALCISADLQISSPTAEQLLLGERMYRDGILPSGEEMQALIRDDVAAGGRRAFDAKVGLEFARASFGSVVRLQVTNYTRIAGDHSPAVAEALLTHLAGVLDGSVRTHDRVYRWGQDELLVVMPRAIPKVARARVEFTMGRTAPMATQGMPKGLVAEAAVTVEAYRGAEDLADAAEAASHH